MGKKILDSKLLYALLAIIFAITLWFYVAAVENNDDDITITGVPINFVNEEVLEESGLMISDGRNQTATLKLYGPVTDLAKLNQEKEKISLTIDVGKITSPGEQTMAYELDLPSIYEARVTVQERYPSNVTFTVSRHIKKDIQVEGKFIGTLEEEYMRGEFAFLPGKISISGEENEVNRVSHALVTVGGDKLTTTVTGNLGFELIDYQGEVLTDIDVTCSVDTVSFTLPVIKTAEVPLSVKWIMGGGISNLDMLDQYVTYEIEPEAITVSGSEEDLAPLKEIILGEIDLADVIGTNSFEFDIPLNDALDNISGTSQATVTVTIHDLVSKVMEVDNIEQINVPEGFSAESVTKTLQVLVRGPEEAIDLILPINLRVVADLSNVDPTSGRYTVPVKVYLDGTTQVGVVGDDYKIVVDIFVAEEQQK